MQGANIIVLSGLLIGLVYGAVGLLSGFCMLSSLRGWWADGDGRLVRTYALAIGVAVAATQLLAAAGLVDLGKSIYLAPSFSAPLMFFGGLLFGYGMVLSNGCGSRALVLVYNSTSPRDIYDERFGGVEGSAYLVGGLGVNFQKNRDIILAPIRTGVGARLGANVGYLKYTQEPEWNPF